MRLLCFRISRKFTRKRRIPTEPLRHEYACRCPISPDPVLPWRRLRLQDCARGAERTARGHAACASLPKDLLVGTESSDDAAVYRLNDTQAIVATTDFFMPIVDDPYDFGRIAATNALSDVYAMGGNPIMALAIVGMPLDKLPLEVIQKILAGGESVCALAGIPIAGGHSIDVLEPIYGLVGLGLVHPDRVKRNDSAREGDVLILGKPLGVGILSAALKKGALSAAGYAQMIAATTQLNTPGTALGRTAAGCMR